MRCLRFAGMGHGLCGSFLDLDHQSRKMISVGEEETLTWAERGRPSVARPYPTLLVPRPGLLNSVQVPKRHGGGQVSDAAGVYRDNCTWACAGFACRAAWIKSTMLKDVARSATIDKSLLTCICAVAKGVGGCSRERMSRADD